MAVYDDVEDEKLKELSETSSQMIEKIKDFLVSKEDKWDKDNACDNLTKESDSEVNKMKEDHEVSKEGKTTRRKTRLGGRKRKKTNNDAVPLEAQSSSKKLCYLKKRLAKRFP